MLRFAVGLLVCLALTAPGTGAQVVTEQIQGPRGGMQLGAPAREMKTGTGRIRGRIVSADTGTPVRRAQVRLSGPEVGMRTALTDAEGRFEFQELPAGRFTINVSKSGYVSIQYGQTRPFESGKTIDLGDKQILDRVDIALPRGGVISGRIIDEFGEPMPDTSVQALRSTWSNGRRRLQPTGRTAMTNDLGQYRLYGLPPGEYYVSATMGGAAAVTSFDGGAAEVVGLRVAAVTSAVASSATASAPTSGYAPTYYPGTTSGAEAQRVTVSAGQEIHGADIALSPVRLARVSGTVINSQGQPVPNTMVNLVPRSLDSMAPLFGLNTGGRTDTNGNFTITGVAPGDYTLQTRGGTQIIQAGEGRTMVFTMRQEIEVDGRGGGSNEPEIGSVPVTVAGDDVTHVMVVTAPGGRANGQVTFEGGKPDNFSMMRIMASPVDSDGPTMMVMGGTGEVRPDGSFQLSGLAGARLIRALSVPPGWTLKSVRLNGQDITDTGAEFKAGVTVAGLEIVLTNRLTSVTGTVTDGSSQPVKDYTVVVFPEDSTLWTVPQSRYIMGVRPDQEGRFQLRNLPAGDYRAVAVEYIEQGTWGDPDVLARLRSMGTSFTLREGDQQTLSLTLGR